MPANKHANLYRQAIDCFTQGLTHLIQAAMPESNTETKGYVRRAGALKFLDISASKFHDLMNEEEIPEGKEIGGTLHWKWAWLEKYTEDPQRNINSVKRVPPKKRKG